MFNQYNLRHFLVSYVVLDVSKSLKNEYILPKCVIKKNVTNILQPIPSHEFIIYVLTKLCKLLKEFG